MTTPTIHNLAADIADRIEGMNLDSRLNNAEVIATLIKPVYEELTAARAANFACQRELDRMDKEVTHLREQRDHAVRMEETMRMEKNALQRLINQQQTTEPQLA